MPTTSDHSGKDHCSLGCTLPPRSTRPAPAPPHTQTQHEGTTLRIPRTRRPQLGEASFPPLSMHRRGSVPVEGRGARDGGDGDPPRPPGRPPPPARGASPLRLRAPPPRIPLPVCGRGPRLLVKSSPLHCTHLMSLFFYHIFLSLDLPPHAARFPTRFFIPSIQFAVMLLDS